MVGAARREKCCAAGLHAISHRLSIQVQVRLAREHSRGHGTNIFPRFPASAYSHTSLWNSGLIRVEQYEEMVTKTFLRKYRELRKPKSLAPDNNQVQVSSVYSNSKHVARSDI
jgi:hypothetical protein